MNDEKKSFHNPKTVVFKEQNRKKIIKTDLRTTRQKVLLKLHESQRKKAINFVLTFRQVKNSTGDFFILSFVGFIWFASWSPHLSKFRSQTSFFSFKKVSTQTWATACVSQSEKRWSGFFFLHSFCTPSGNRVRKKFPYLFFQRFWTPKIIWKPFCWSFCFVFHTFFSCEIVHSQSKFSCLSKHFPRGCAFCLFIKHIFRKNWDSLSSTKCLCFSFCMFVHLTSCFRVSFTFSSCWPENPYPFTK